MVVLVGRVVPGKATPRGCGAQAAGAALDAWAGLAAAGYCYVAVRVLVHMGMVGRGSGGVNAARP